MHLAEQAGHLDKSIPAVLRIHIPEVANHDATESTDHRIGFAVREIARRWPVTYHGDLICTFVAPAHGHGAVTFISRDDVVCEPETHPLQKAQNGQHSTAGRAETILVEFGHEIVMIEYKALSKQQTIRRCDNPQQIRRIRHVYDVEAVAQRYPCGQYGLRD